MSNSWTGITAVSETDTVRIQDLPVASALTGTDLMIVNQGTDLSSTRKTTVSAVRSGMANVRLYAGATIIFDDANAVTKSDLMPVAVANNFRAGIAVFHSGISGSYDYVTLPEALEWRKTVNGEILSHSMNSVPLTTAYNVTYRNSLISSSQREFSQMGFNPHGFVAPSSTLAADSVSTVSENYDYAFIRSAKYTTNAGAVNALGANRWNLVRISLEPSATNPGADMTLDRAKQFVDYAAETGGYICFYTHKYIEWLPELMQYIKSTIPNILPVEWIGQQWGLNKNTSVLPTENLIKNTSFDTITPNGNPFGWDIDTSALSSPAQKVTIGNGIGVLEINSAGTNPAGTAGYIRYKHQTGPIKVYTPICFSINASSLLATNTSVTLSMSLVSATGGVLRQSPSRDYVISANRPTIYINDGFRVQPSDETNASYILIEIKFQSMAAGPINITVHSPQLERAGLPTPYKYSMSSSNYFSRLRNEASITVEPNISKRIVFNAILEGSNSVYDTTSGYLSSSDGRNYLMQVNVGLNGLVAGDIVELFLVVQGGSGDSYTYPANFVAHTGNNVFMASWTVRGDTRSYAVGIRHNSSALRSLTTNSNAVLTISATN